MPVFSIQFWSKKVTKIRASNHDKAEKIAQKMFPKEVIVLISPSVNYNNIGKIKFTHIGIGWDANTNYLAVSCCDKKHDIEILCTDSVSSKNIPKYITDFTKGIIETHQVDNSTFTFVINSKGNTKIVNAVAQQLKRKFKFKEYPDNENTAIRGRVIIRTDISLLESNSKKMLIEHLPELPQTKIAPNEYNAEICAITGLYFQLKQFETIISCLKFSKIEKMRLLTDNDTKRNRLKSNSSTKKTGKPFLIPVNDFGKMVPGVE